METPLRVRAIDHVELFVPDRHEAAEWYARVLGLEVVKGFEDWAEPRDGPLMIVAADGRTKLALFEGPPASRAGEPTGIRRIAFATDAAGLARFAASAESLDLRNARVVDHDRALSIYFTDPWGTALELTTYDVAEARALLR